MIWLPSVTEHWHCQTLLLAQEWSPTILFDIFVMHVLLLLLSGKVHMFVKGDAGICAQS